jgi:trk system potassium uptake protein TrkA
MVTYLRIVIVGAGDIGLPVIHYLSERGHLITVIEKDEAKCKRIADNADAVIFQGSGEEKEIWKNVEADKMDALMALTNNDETNIAVCEIAKRDFGIPFVIARAHQPESINLMKVAGADIAICPSIETRRLFLNAIESRTVETVYEKENVRFKIALVTIPQNGVVIGKNRDRFDEREKIRITGIFRNGDFVFASESFIFKGGDKVLLLGESETVEKTAEKLREAEIT